MIDPSLRKAHHELVAICMSKLTAREKEVAQALKSGKTNKQIAADLGVSLGAVNLAVRFALAKTGLRNRTELAALIAGRFEI